MGLGMVQLTWIVTRKR